LADDPLQKPEKPQAPEDDDSKADDNNMKTLELEKTLYNIGNLLQMAYG
jgi:hypothetical protein